MSSSIQRDHEVMSWVSDLSIHRNKSPIPDNDVFQDHDRKEIARLVRPTCQPLLTVSNLDQSAEKLTQIPAKDSAVVDGGFIPYLLKTIMDDCHQYTIVHLSASVLYELDKNSKIHHRMMQRSYFKLI